MGKYKFTISVRYLWDFIFSFKYFQVCFFLSLLQIKTTFCIAKFVNNKILILSRQQLSSEGPIIQTNQTV